MNQRTTPWREWNTSRDGQGKEAANQSEERSHLLQLLDERLRFETLLARLSAAFINLPAEAVDSQIEGGLQQIVEFLHIERSGLGQFSEDGSQLVTTHSFTMPGFPPFPPVNLAAIFPWYTARIREGQVLRFCRLPDDLPAAAVAERQYCLQQGMRSQLTIPFKVGDALLGGIGFASFRRQRDWPDDLVQSLQLVAEIFANAQARKRAEARAARLREQLTLVARVTMMGELAASIAHEVNQPLCAIVSNAQAVQRMLAHDGFDLQEVRAALQDIGQDGQRASAVIAGIRGLFTNEPRERVPVNVNDLIREVAALMRGEMAKRGVAVKLELAARLPVVSGDRVELQQVILNLMTNGADAMDRVARELRELVIRSTNNEAGTITVAVQDVGVGLDPRNLGRIFEAFVTTKPGSMGMGLAICKSIVEAHGGTIWGVANPDRGATLQFALPGAPEGKS